MKTLFALILIISAAESFAQASAVTVRCTSRSREAVEVKMKAGQFIDWSRSSFVSPSSTSLFDMMKDTTNEDREEGPAYEWVNQGRSRNGFQIVELGTTADSHKLGVKVGAMKKGDKMPGFYEYKDLGSGSGNSREDLNCLVK